MYFYGRRSVIASPSTVFTSLSGRAYVQIRGQRHYLGQHGTPESKETYGRFVAELRRKPDVPAAVVPTPAPPA